MGSNLGLLHFWGLASEWAAQLGGMAFPDLSFKAMRYIFRGRGGLNRCRESFTG